jgi:hypothetical protein
MTLVGGGMAAIGGTVWLIAALVSPGREVWATAGAVLSVATIVVAQALGSRAGFWGWLAIRGFVVGAVAVVGGQILGGNLGPSFQMVGLVTVWLTGLFAAIGASMSGEAGRFGPMLAIAGWFLVYLTFIIPVGPLPVAPYGVGWGMTGVHLIRARAQIANGSPSSDITGR